MGTQSVGAKNVVLGIIQSYVAVQSEQEAKRAELNQKIEKEHDQIRSKKKKIEKLQEKRAKIKTPSWVDMIVTPLAQELARRMGKKFKIFGPFGLRCETSIHLFDDSIKSISQQETWGITLIPRELARGEIHYETGEVKNKFEKDSIGAINGMNNVTAPLPDSIEEIMELLRH